MQGLDMNRPQRWDEASRSSSGPVGGDAWAWTAFWQEQNANGRCLANAHREVRSVLDRHWTEFAASLPPASQVLDIGCGAGIVGKLLLSARNELHVTGVDLASVPPSRERRLRLISGVAMEGLPFEGQQFDAVVSQFGFEYGSIARTAPETARVLARGGLFSFIVHHAHSPIVRENRVRDRALHAAFGPRVEKAFLLGNAGELDHELQLACRDAQSDALVDQIANALRSRLVLDRDQRLAIWNAVLEAVAPERQLNAALERSCVAPDRLEEWLSKLTGSLHISHVSALRRRNGEVIAWTIEGAKKSKVSDKLSSATTPRRRPVRGPETCVAMPLSSIAARPHEINVDRHQASLGGVNSPLMGEPTRRRPVAKEATPQMSTGAPQ
jgi:SAM-dependent methyltransferase